jgi:hypothetical protein
MTRYGLILAALLALAVQAAPASAAPVYQLNQQGNWGVLPAGGFGTVTLTQLTSTEVQVSVDITASGYFFNSLGNSYALTWSLDVAGATVSNITASSDSSDFSNQAYSSTGTYAASPFTSSPCSTSGNCFTDAILFEPSSFSTQITTLSFDITKSGGLSLSNFVTDNKGDYFATDLGHGGTRNYMQNFAASVPEPATWLLFFGGLIGLTLLRLRRRTLVWA